MMYYLEWLLKLIFKVSYIFQENVPVIDDEVMVIDFLNNPFFQDDIYDIIEIIARKADVNIKDKVYKK